MQDQLSRVRTLMSHWKEHAKDLDKQQVAKENELKHAKSDLFVVRGQSAKTKNTNDVKDRTLLEAEQQTKELSDYTSQIATKHQD